MKKIVSIMLVCLFLFTGVLATAFAVSADENVDFKNADFDEFINTLVGSLESVTDKDTRAARFKWYLDTIGKKDSEIDARIAELYSGSAIADTMLNDLLGGGMDKAQIRLVLEVLKSLPESERKAAIDEFYDNQENGASYTLDADLDAAYKGIYDKYINASFQTTVYNDYGLEYKDFIPLFRVITKNITLTKDSEDNLAVLSVSDAFGANILANVTATSINGVAIKDKYTVIDQIVGNGITDDNKGVFTDAFKGEDAYELVGNVSGDAEGVVDEVDVQVLSQYVVGWTSVKTEVDADPTRLSAGAMIDPSNETINADDLLKLLQYLAGWPGLILGRK